MGGILYVLGIAEIIFLNKGISNIFWADGRFSGFWKQNKIYQII
jgi:hypothetical protein